MAIRQHPDHEEDEEAVGEADAEQPVHVEDHVEVHVEGYVEDHVENHVKDHVKEHVACGLRPVHVEENHVDKTLFVQPSISLVKVLCRNHDESHCH